LIFIGIIIECVLGAILTYIPGINKAVGYRPIPIYFFIAPGAVFAILMIILEEFRKIITRKLMKNKN